MKELQAAGVLLETRLFSWSRTQPDFVEPKYSFS